MAKKKDEETKNVVISETDLDANPGIQVAETTYQRVPVSTPQPPLLTFDRYFASTGKPAHHKAGMLKFLQGKGIARKSKEAWDAFFAKY